MTRKCRILAATICALSFLFSHAVAQKAERTGEIAPPAVVATATSPVLSFHAAAVGVAFLLLVVPEARIQAVEPLHFNRDVRPILSEHCFACHGRDANARKAGLRLDLREKAVSATESGAIPIVPRKPDASEMVRRIFNSDESQMMPPPSALR